MKVDNASLTVDIYIQLNGPNKVRLVNYMASIKKVTYIVLGLNTQILEP